MKFKTENGKIIPDRSMTKEEAQARLVKMKSRQTTIAAKISNASGAEKTNLETRKVKLDEGVTSLEAEIGKI